MSTIPENKVVYFGVININENNKTIGAIDIWRNVINKKIYCEEKRLGILEIVDYIGMPAIAEGQEWAVAINRNRIGKERWKLIKIIKSGKYSFIDTDDETPVKVNVSDYKIVDDIWWCFLVAKNVNRSIEITNEASPK
ncbi:MAG TPA: hypothetical protein VFH19_00275 [Nitrososphaeraceae archaeon]|jgi:hypothetical protein|nr:hypothetical protein [Nitrososphaeraceae archaeon]